MLTGREQELFTALTRKIRLLTFEQIVRAWWPDSEAGRTNAKRRLRELYERGFLARIRVLSRPLLPLEAPVLRWKPGEAEPDFGAVSWRLQSRWQEPARTVTAYLATKRAAHVFGGVTEGRLKNPAHATHDIHVGAVYLHLLRTAPALAAGWVGEDIVAPTREGQKLPDSIVHDAAGTPKFVIEFGGAYAADRVAAFHADCAARILPYEIW
jgi:hypothetical protein